MRAVVQRVKKARLSVRENLVSEIGKGFLVLLGVGEEDTRKDAEYIAKKVAGLRVFEDENGKMNLSLKEVEGEILLVSQFTLFGDVRKGFRPSFTKSAKSEMGEEYYQKVTELLEKENLTVKRGIFGEDMDIDFVNSGPVTILMDSTKVF